MAEKKKGNFLGSIGQFFRDVRSEMKKVTYPSSKQVINNTIIVLVSCTILGLFIWGLDIGFESSVRAIVGQETTEEIPQDVLDQLNDITVDENGNVIDNSGTVSQDVLDELQSQITVDENGNVVIPEDLQADGYDVTVE